METKPHSFEQPFVQRIVRFAEWLAERTPLQRSDPHERLRRASSARDDDVARSHWASSTFGLLHPANALTAGLVCHKVLERLLTSLPALDCSPWQRKADFEDTVHCAFLHSSRLAPGLAPLFLSAAEAVHVIPGTQPVLNGIRLFLEDFKTYPLDNIEPDTLGMVFESLIPWVERHQLGQFYTPAFIAEILVRWAVRRPTDRVLDPACGAGIILTKAYAQLHSLEKRHPNQPLEKDRDRGSRNQLLGFDVNPAAIRLAAASLAMQALGSRPEAAGFIVEDFFNVLPQETATKDDFIASEREAVEQAVSIPLVDAVMTNPPYTRWSELPRTAREQIQEKLGSTLRTYGLSPRRGWGAEAGLHIHFALWAHRFLRSGGRLALIISDSWLQTDFGTAFGRFLLEHFRVRAVVDLGGRVFNAPMVGTCLLLLEREDDAAARAASTTRFIYLKGANGIEHSHVEDMLQAIDGNQPNSPNLSVREVDQQKIPAASKWINNLFDIEASLEPLQRSPLMTRLENLCDVAYGNTAYLVLTSKGAIRGVPNVGGEQFFHLSDHDAQTWRLSAPWIYPLLSSGRYARFFRFTKTDWEALRSRNVRCWLFTAHHGCKQPRAVREYIRRGETSVRLRGMKRSGETAKTVSESFAASVRRRYPEYFQGWFDLGGTEPAPIFAIRGAQHRPRFVLTDFPVGLDDRLVALVPKVAFDQQHLMALVGALNSTFTQLQIEATCRSTGGGMVELDLRHASDLLVPDVTQLPFETVKVLATLFQELELRARQLGGADRKARLDALTPIFDKIDRALAGVMGLPEFGLRRIQETAETLAQRRLSRVTTQATM